LGCFFTVSKAVFPFILADLSSLAVPEALKHKWIVQQDPNAARELRPD
jgi:hypothetical protein